MASIKETRLFDTITTQLQATPEFNRLPPQTKAIINNSINQSAAQLVPEYVNTIDTESNRALNSIPQNLVGKNNPVDVVAGNLSTNNLKTTINDKIGGSLNNDLASRLTDVVIGKFATDLPPEIRSRINLNQLASAINGSSQIALERGIDENINLFSGDVLSGKVPVQSVVRDVGSYFDRLGADGLQEVNKVYDSSIANQAIIEAQNFNVNSPENKEKLATQTTGFIDPTATYPTREYAGRSETNKLAQGEIQGTVVQTKEKDRLTGIQLPNNESWEQPQIPFKGEYPYNKVIQTEGGHIIEIDDTPGCERLHIYHRSGTFVEIDANGSVVKKTKGSSYEIIDKNGYISISGDANLSVKNGVKIYVGGDADIEVEGDTNVKCLNDITMQASGRVDISATEEINFSSANINIEANVNLNIRAENSAYLSTREDMHFKANGTIFHQTLESYNIKATGDINADGDEIYLKSDKAQEATYAGVANIGTIGPRKDIITETISDPVAPNYLDKLGYGAEDSEFESEAVAQQKQLKELGIITDKEIGQVQIPIESETPISTASTVVRPDTFIIQQTYLPDNYQLSKHFTLAQLSSKAVVSNYPVQAQLGLTYGQIVFNLAGCALNICEPILALYPNMFVTSAFRTARNSSTTSDHPRGKAVDIQFKGVSKADYYEIAKKLATNLVYDKLLLEYKNYGTGLPWIHISFDVDKPRKLVLTYFNDKKYSDGLTNLA